jgi:putative endopeptidase
MNMTSAMAPYMSKALVQASFESGKIFSGSPNDKPRWKKAVRVATENLDHLISKKYVEKYYPKEAKDKMDEMINNIQVSMESHIKGLTWMGDATKQKALQKLGTIMKKIGFPSKWRDYKGLEIKKDDLFGNILAATKHENERRFKELNRPVDKQEWGMPASIVNAYYNPSFNEIVFPAGILQFPFFDYKADDALNYGAIGLVIGHEITHGFDDQGCHYDHVGKMSDWWTPEDAKQFEAKTAKLVSLYDNCVGVDNMHVKGALTLGENIADFGGLAISYDAFKMTKQSKENKSIDGFTPDQRFFLGFARCWRNKARKEQEITQLQSDPHSPPKYRVLMPLANFDAFYTAFNVKPTNKMYIKPEDRVKVW